MTNSAVTRMASGFDIVDHFYNESDLCSLATLSREHSGLLILCLWLIYCVFNGLFVPHLALIVAQIKWQNRG